MYHGIARSNGLSYWPSVAYTLAGNALGKSPAKPRRRPATIRLPAALPARSWASRRFESRVFCLDAPTMDRVSGEDWRRCSSLRRPASIMPWSAIPLDRSRRCARCRSPTSASRSAQPRLRPAVQDKCPRWWGINRISPCRWTTGIREMPATGNERPFDHFRIDEHLGEWTRAAVTSGLIAGGDYERGDWPASGLYGTYDYLAPDEFRFSSTAFTFGTTLQAAMSESLWCRVWPRGRRICCCACIRPDRRARLPLRLAPQALASLRVIAGRRAALDVTARHWTLSAPTAGSPTGQRDLIFVGDASLAFRLLSPARPRPHVPVGQSTRSISSGRTRLESVPRSGCSTSSSGSGGFGMVR